MKDYFALLTKPRNIQKLLKTEPSKPSKGASEGNDGLGDKGFQNFVSPKPYISVSGDLVIPFDSDRKYHYWRGGQSVWETLVELGAGEEVWRKYQSPLSVVEADRG